MGKNKNKRKDPWDLSFEEQQALLNNFDEMVSNTSPEEITESDTDAVWTKKYGVINPVYESEDNFPSIEDQLLECINSDNDTQDSKLLDNIVIATSDSDIVINENPTPVKVDIDYRLAVDNTETVSPVMIDNLPSADEKKIGIDDISIKINYINPLDKLIIDDGTTKKTFAVDRAVEDNIYEISEDDFDDDEVSDKSSLLLGYIITCQHPWAIVPTATFERDFKSVESFDFKSYIFVNIDSFICIYVLSETNRDTLLSLMDTYDMNKSECMNFWISLAYHCGIINNAFYVENTDYMLEFINLTVGHYETFKEIFFNDSNTIVSDSTTDISEYIDDCKFVQSTAREFLSSIADKIYSYDDEDDDEDDDEEEDSEEEIYTPDVEDVDNNSSSTVVPAETTTARELYMQSMQKANILKTSDENEGKDNGDDDDNMTFTVITRDS